MSYGDDSGITISRRDVMPSGPPEPMVVKREETIITTSRSVPFGLLVRMLNSHKITYRIEGETIVVPDAP